MHELTIKNYLHAYQRLQATATGQMQITAKVHHFNTSMNIMLQVPADVCLLLPNPAWGS